MPFIRTRLELGPDDVGRRLDRIIRAVYPGLPLSAVYRLFREGSVCVGPSRVDGAYRTKAGDVVELRLPEGVLPVPSPSTAARAGETATIRDAEAFARLVLAEGDDLCVVDKPRGLLSHGPGGLDELARAYYARRIASSLAFSPGPLHRLDRNTSGVLVVSASQAGARAFSEALRAGRVGKAYLALLSGELGEPEAWEDELSRDGEARLSRVGSGGRAALSRAFPLLAARGLTLALVELGTGRTHQIRAQASARGHPLAGDSKYGGAPLGRREAGAASARGSYLLHSAVVSIPEGAGLAEARPVAAPLSPWAQATLRATLGGDYLERVAMALEGLAPPYAEALIEAIRKGETPKKGNKLDREPFRRYHWTKP